MKNYRSTIAFAIFIMVVLGFFATEVYSQKEEEKKPVEIKLEEGAKKNAFKIIIKRAGNGNRQISIQAFYVIDDDLQSLLEGSAKLKVGCEAKFIIREEVKFIGGTSEEVKGFEPCSRRFEVSVLKKF